MCAGLINERYQSGLWEAKIKFIRMCLRVPRSQAQKCVQPLPRGGDDKQEPENQPREQCFTHARSTRLWLLVNSTSQALFPSDIFFCSPSPRKAVTPSPPTCPMSQGGPKDQTRLTPSSSEILVRVLVMEDIISCVL